MKVSQILKVSAVVLALGSVPLHTAFAHEGHEGQTESAHQGSEAGDTDSSSEGSSESAE